MAISSAATNLLGALLPEWHLLLQEWSASGRLTAAAQEALILDGEPQALKDLVSQWTAGDFQAVPEIVLLSNANINGALGAYAQSTGKIYLNADWLATATQEAVNAVLTEELGHYLDGLLNTVDTSGDEGKYFSRMLSGVVLTDSQKAVLRAENDQGMISVGSKILDVEYAVAAPAIRGNNLYTYTIQSDWTSSEAYAVELGGHLVTINDAAENLWVTRFGSNVWIGWRKGYQWSSGEVTSYENWLQGQPDGRGFVDYARIGDGGRWFTASNDGSSGAGGYARGIAEIPLSFAITRTGEVKEGAGVFTTSINLNVGNQTSGNLAKGTQVWWKITGITGDDLLSGALSGSGTIQQGKLDIQHSLNVDTDLGESFEVSVYSDAGFTQQIGATNSVVVDEEVANGNAANPPTGLHAGSAPLIRANSLYTLTTTERDWRSAENNAISLGGHLVNIDSIGENDFIVDFFNGLIIDNSYFRHYQAGKLTTAYIGLFHKANTYITAAEWSNGVDAGYRNTGDGWFVQSEYNGFYQMILGSEDPAWTFSPGNAPDATIGKWIMYNQRFGEAPYSAYPWGFDGYFPQTKGIAEIPLQLSITRQGDAIEGTGVFITSINLSAGILSSANLAEGSKVWWRVTGITADDLASGALTGEGIITNGKLDIEHSLKVDSDSGESFEVSVYSDLWRIQQIGMKNISAVVEAPVIRGNSLYTIVNGPSWTEAEAQSVASGGHLAIITSEVENNFLVTNLSSKLSGRNSNFPNAAYGWIGVSRSTGSSQFNYSDNTAITYDRWAPGQPDIPGTGSDYVILNLIDGDPSSGYSSRWDDGTVDWYGYGAKGIAEIPLELSITRQGEVKEGAGLFTTSINLDAGTQASGNLAEGAQVWWKVTGITADDLVSGYLSGSGTIATGKLDLQHSLKVDGDIGENFEVYVYSDASFTSEYQIGTMNSAVVKEADPAIRGNSLYKIVDGPTWTQAEANSVALGGHLAAVTSIEEDDFLYANFDDPRRLDLAQFPAGVFYIGFTDAAQEGTWIWSSGETSTFTNWNSTSPDNYLNSDYALWGYYNSIDIRGWDDTTDGVLSPGIGAPYPGIAEIPLQLSITRQGELKEGAGVFTTSINLSAGTLASGNLAEGAHVWWKVTGITADDLVSGALSGTGTIQNGKLDIQHSLEIDTDYGESFQVSVYSDSSMTAEYQIGSSASTKIVDTENGVSLYYDTSYGPLPILYHFVTAGAELIGGCNFFDYAFYDLSSGNQSANITISRSLNDFKVETGVSGLNSSAWGVDTLSSEVEGYWLQGTNGEDSIRFSLGHSRDGTGLSNAILRTGGGNDAVYFDDIRLLDAPYFSTSEYDGGSGFDTLEINDISTNYQYYSSDKENGNRWELIFISYSRNRRLSSTDPNSTYPDSLAESAIPAYPRMVLFNVEKLRFIDKTISLSLELDASNEMIITSPGAGTIDGIPFINTYNIDLGLGTDTATLTSAAGTNTLMTVHGGDGTDTLNGNENDNILILTGENQGTLDGLVFTGFENVNLGAGNDIVYILPGGSLTGLLNGGGTKKIVYLPPGVPVPPPGGVITPPTTPPTTPPIALPPPPPGFDIDGGYNAIYLNDNANSITHTGAGAGVVDGTNFTNFYSVDLRGGNDTALIQNGGSLAGLLDGGNGTDTLNLNSGANALSINSALSGTAAGTTIAGFESINLADGNDTAEFIFNDISTQAIAPRQSLTIDGGLGTDSIVLNLTPSEVAYLKAQGTFTALKTFLANPTELSRTVALSSVDLTLTGFESGRFANNEPTGIILTPSAVDENLPTTTVAATLSTSDDDFGDTFTYSFATGTGDTDNGSFTLLGNQLFFQASPNYEVKSSYTIRLQTTDAGGLSFQQSVTLNINNLQEGPGNAGPITSSTPSVFTEGVTLSAGSISGDPDGNGTITAYQWYFNDGVISGETIASFTTTAIGFGTYKVALTYTDGKGDPTTVLSADQVVAKIDNGQGALSAITGNGAFNEGVTLSAGTVTGDPDGTAVNPSYSYQWYLNNTVITGAIGTTHTVGATGFGTYKVTVTYTDGQDYSTTLTSADQVVSKIDNGQGTLSAITGNGALNEGVTLTAGSISGDPDGTAVNHAYSYQWYIGASAITGATSSTYAVGAQGTGTYKVAVTYTDGQSYTTTLTSADQVVAKIDNGQGTLSATTGNGAFNEGVTLTAGTVSDDPDGTAVNPSYSYQWYLNNSLVSGANSSSFTVGPQGTGTYKVAVTYTDGQSYTTTLTSADQVVAKIDNGQGTLSPITGNGALNEGVTLIAGTVSGDPDGNGTINTYQWYNNGTAISNATAASYLVPIGGAGTYTVQVSHTDGQGYSTLLTSAGTVVASPPPPSDTTAPTLTSIAVHGTAVILTFSEAVTASSVLATAFSVQTVSSNNTATNRTYTNVARDLSDPSKLILTLTGTAPASNVNLRVSYTDPTGNQTSGVVQDLAGNDLASFSNRFADTFFTGSSTTLASQYQNLILTGTSNVNGTGNALNNSITGNSGNNTLSGLTGADNMAGGLGNDTYIVDNTGDVVTEDVNAGTDSVHSSVTYALGANLENLTLTGSAAINGTGNSLNNFLTGNSAANILSGGDGSDTLIGGTGADTLTGSTGTDTFRFALADSRFAAFDRITDFTIGTDILDGPTAVTAANLRELGSVSALSATAIASVLTTANFARNGAATFSFGAGPTATARTFLAVNDGTAGFSSTSDGLIEITGYSGQLTNLAIA